MNIQEWRSSLVLNECKRQKKVLIITLPFLKIPGFYRNIFPNASLFFVSLQKLNRAISPHLYKQNRNIEAIEIDYLDQHLKLVQQYWDTDSSWLQWKFLEDDFSTLSKLGFSFKKGDIHSYKIIIEQVSRLYCQWIIKFINKNRINSICVYGRGHWSMNSASAAAKLLNLPIFVIERGILEDTYIVDINMPFTFPGSDFRKNWQEYLELEEEQYLHEINYKRSHWDIYLSYASESLRNIVNYPFPFSLFIGQCLFDLNLLNAPFNNFKSFIKLCISRLPSNKCTAIIYRPHPLSPEYFKKKEIRIKQYSIIVDNSHPSNLFLQNPYIVTWNSTMGLEASLFFNCRVQTLDPNCYYSNIINKSELKRKFLQFLNEVSISEVP